MPTDKTKERKRMVVEEVNEIPKPQPVAVEPQPIIEQIPTPVVTQADVPTIETEIVPEFPTPQPLNNIEEIDNTDDNPSNITWILIPGIMLLGALLGGIIFYQNKVTDQEGEEPTSLPTQVSEASPTPTATPVSENVDLEKYTLVLQNGSGIKGEATKVKDLLVKAGFKVGTTGNASSFDYTSTIVKAKEGTDSGFITKLKEVLGESYKLGKDEVLKSSSTDDIVIIIGSTKI